MARLSIRDGLIERLQARARQLGISLDDALELLLDDAEGQPHDHLRVLAERLPDTTLIFDIPSRRIEYINHPTFLGYPSETLQRPNALLDILHQADRNAVFQHWQMLVSEASNALFTIEYRLCDHQGAWRWIRSRDRVMQWSENGSVVRALAILTDITEARQVEDRLRESEVRYQTLFDQTNDAVFIIDQDLIYLEVNQRAADMLGYTIEELVGRPASDFIVPDEQRDVARRRTSLLGGEHLPVYERRFYRKDGSEIVGEINVTLVRDEQGSPRYFQSVVRDVTARKRIEQQAWQSRELLAKILENFQSAVFIMDRRGRKIVECNPAVTNIFGYSRDEIIGNSSDFLHVSDEARAAFRSKVAEAVEQQGSLHLAEYEMKRKDGSTFPSEHYVTPLYDDHNTVVGWMSVVRDISLRKRAQEQTLALAVERERGQVLGAFIRDASHEFRTPLSIINTKVYLLERMVESESERAHLDDIRQQVAKIVRVVDALVTMTRLESKSGTSVETVDLNQVLRAVCFAQQSLLIDHNLGLEIELVPHLPAIHGNMADITLAISEIMSNAIRFTPPGGQIVARTCHDEGGTGVEIKDSGIGIDSDHLARIFERFYRVDRAHTTPGLGLGLAIAYKIVTDHGGLIDVDSVPGEGSTFRVLFPTPEAGG